MVCEFDHRKNRIFRWVTLCLTALIAFTSLVTTERNIAFAGQRMSDKDLERRMTNLRNDAKRFGDAFNPAIGKSTIRKTQREKDAKALVKTFENRTNRMLNQFKQNKQAEPALSNARDSASRIDKLLTNVPLGPQVTEARTKIKTELSMVSDVQGG